MNTKIKVILAGILVAVVVIFFVVRNNETNKQDGITMPEEEAIDFVLDFYDRWLIMSTSTDRFGSETLNTSIFSEDVLSKIETDRAEFEDLDPITCQSNVMVEQFAARPFPVSEIETKILIESRSGDTTLPTMAFVTATVVDGVWKVTNIECTAGDVAPDVEFNYDREGLLLKSVPPPFTAGQWHLVFEQDGQMGHVTPLFFSATTTCISVEGVESICNPDTFTETARVIVKGSMTEVGAEVQRVEFK